jgi:uncharacterized protein with FMN-binding domain
MKRVLFAVTGTILGLVALLSFKSRAQPLANAGPLPAATSTGTPVPTKTSGTAPRRQRTSSAAQPAKSYMGQAVQTPYGVVQVQVTATGSHVVSVKLAQLTAYDGRSQQINSYAAPILVNETTSAQSAQIDTVSGATYTSEGYIQSLQSALDQAGIR